MPPEPKMSLGEEVKMSGQWRVAAKTFAWFWGRRWFWQWAGLKTFGCGGFKDHKIGLYIYIYMGGGLFD